MQDLVNLRNDIQKAERALRNVRKFFNTYENTDHVSYNELRGELEPLTNQLITEYSQCLYRLHDMIIRMKYQKLTRLGWRKTLH